MPCMCWYTPPEKEKQIFKDRCQAVVDQIKKLEEHGDPDCCTLEDAKNLIHDLYHGKCREGHK